MSRSHAPLEESRSPKDGPITQSRNNFVTKQLQDVAI